MKTAYCLNCEQDKQVQKWMPDRCICCACLYAEKHGDYLVGHAPGWVEGGKGWTPERHAAYEATCEASMMHAGEEAAFQREKAFMDAFLGTVQDS